MIPQLSDEQFKSEFRMTVTTFSNIVDRIANHSVFKSSGRHQQTPCYIQAMVVFWRLGRTATLPDAAAKFAIGKGSVVNFTNRMLNALLSL